LIAGTLLAVILMIASLITAIKYTKALNLDDKLEFLLVYIVIGMFSIWFIDKVVASRITLLNDKEQDAVQQILFTVISFVLGGQREKKKQKQDGDSKPEQPI